MDNKTEPPTIDAKAQRRRDLQRRSRRSKNLISKAVQMSILCDAEVYLGIRIRENGRVTTFCSDPAGIWGSTDLRGYYPVPIQMTLDDFLEKDDPNGETSDKDGAEDED